jgi:hypothetical protein
VVLGVCTFENKHTKRENNENIAYDEQIFIGKIGENF